MCNQGDKNAGSSTGLMAPHKVIDVVQEEFYKVNLTLDNNFRLSPPDKTTNFTTAGMQWFKNRFNNPDGTRCGSRQSCLRTNDLSLIGDGTHLTYFEMLGNFSFGNNDYEQSVELWHNIVSQLKIPVTYVTVHPSQKYHKRVWERLHYPIKEDESCVWSDGNIGGYCCEMFVNDLEIGNLVNTSGVSTDVGFGFERLVQVYENQTNIHDTTLFDCSLPPFVRDHVRALNALYLNGIKPGASGPNYSAKLILRRVLSHLDPKCYKFGHWLEQEKLISEDGKYRAKKHFNRYGIKDYDFVKATFGLTAEEYEEVLS